MKHHRAAPLILPNISVLHVPPAEYFTPSMETVSSLSNGNPSALSFIGNYTAGISKMISSLQLSAVYSHIAVYTLLYIPV